MYIGNNKFSPKTVCEIIYPSKEENKHLKKDISIEGTGLGMNITMSLLELMGGKLELESTYQKGSTFTVTIPQQIISSEPIGKVSMQEKMIFHFGLMLNLQDPLLKTIQKLL